MRSKKTLTIVLFAPLVVLLLAACKKDHKILGVDVQPQQDALYGSFRGGGKVIAFTQKTDSVISYNSNKYKYLGCNQDPYFGRTEVGLYLNTSMSVSNLTFGIAPVLVSAELVLAVDINSVTGNNGSKITYSVYPVDSVLSSSRYYYTSNTRLHNKNAAAWISSSTYTNINGAPVVRIPIDSLYALGIITQPVYTIDNDSYQKQYKGFYIKCSNQANEEGAIFRCNLEDDLSGFYIRYRQSPSDTVQTQKFSFGGSNAARFNTVTYDYSKATGSLKAQLQGDTTAGSSNLFVKGLGLNRLKIYIPSLVSYADSFKIAVNRAEVIFNVDPSFDAGTYSLYNYPPKLSLLPIDSSGVHSLAYDQLDASDALRYDGGYDSDNKRYVFNIARHVQAIFNGKIKNNGFYLEVTDPDYNLVKYLDAYIERVGFYGTAHPTLKPVFNLSYIKLDKN